MIAHNDYGDVQYNCWAQINDDQKVSKIKNEKNMKWLIQMYVEMAN